jgi:hypothetical protein
MRDSVPVGTTCGFSLTVRSSPLRLQPLLLTEAIAFDQLKPLLLTGKELSFTANACVTAKKESTS